MEKITGACQKSLEAKNARNDTSNSDGSPQKSDECFIVEKDVHMGSDKEEKIHVQGRRIVDFEYFMKQIITITSHNSLFNCGINHLTVIKENKTGLHSKITLQCNMCRKKFELETTNMADSKMNINQQLIAGIISIGGGYTQLNTILCNSEIPPISQRLYSSTQDLIFKWWEQTAEHCMKEAGKEEYGHAKSIGSTDSNGTPMIPVIADACWSKRSYGSNCAAASGAAAVIGQYSKKVLYCGVKNKYCVTCSRHENKEAEPPDHQCCKNFKGPSTAMEAAIITEGFKKSQDDHGLIYSHLIADGDSSTYASITNARPYENVTVGKLECKNHLLRNYCKSLLQICTNTVYHIRARKLLKENYLRLRWGVDSSIKYWSNKSISFEEKVSNIKNDIINGPYHIFGDHSNCASYFCKEKTSSNNMVPELTGYGVFQKISELAHRLSLNAYSFAYNVTNNLVESYNSRVAQFVGGKRVNYSLKNSYACRCAAAVVAFNTGLLQTTVHRFIFGTEPNPLIKHLEERRKKLNTKRSLKKVTKKKVRVVQQGNSTTFYGTKSELHHVTITITDDKPSVKSLVK